jgi:Asp-tRNA(Asn)/Glu-tRNA(Gln) amidotransferase A subunit family amidase
MKHPRELSASEMKVAIERREVTCEQIVRDCLERIAEREGVVGAWAFLDTDLALRKAREIDRIPPRGTLHGVPIGVKDIIETADMPTEMGSLIYKGYSPPADAACVALLKAAGALILGKTVTAEFAGSFPGKTANPLDLSRTPGGSSSGSAAAVADHMVPGALGTQTGGSVLRPASFCGVFGFKPSFGRYNRAGVKPAAESLDTIAWIARTLEDIRLFDAALVGDRGSAQPLARPPRIGVCRTHLWPRAEAATVDAIEDAAQRLETAKADVREITLPVGFGDLTPARERINNYERARGLAYEWENHRVHLSDRLRQSIEKGFALSFDQYRAAMDLAAKWRAKIGDSFEGCDVILTACVRGEAPLGLADTGDPKFQELWTLLHLPSIALPTHRGPNGLPVAIQLVGPPARDERLLEVAAWARDVLALTAS